MCDSELQQQLHEAERSHQAHIATVEQCKRSFQDARKKSQTLEVRSLTSGSSY